MGRTRLFHTVVIVGAGLLSSCGKGDKQTAPAAAGSSAKPVDAAQPADSAEAPADAAIDATPVDAGTVDAPHAKKKPVPVIKKPPPDHIRIMVYRDPPDRPRIQALDGKL